MPFMEISENKLNPIDFETKINNTEIAYQVFFDECDQLIADIEQSIESPEVERILTQADVIKSEIQQIFYKEKLILFPFFLKTYSEELLIPKPHSISQIVEKNKLIAEKVRHFKSDLIKTESVNSSSLHNHVVKVCDSWDLLCEQKDEIYNSFLFKKVRKE